MKHSGDFISDLSNWAYSKPWPTQTKCEQHRETFEYFKRLRWEAGQVVPVICVSAYSVEWLLLQLKDQNKNMRQHKFILLKCPSETPTPYRGVGVFACPAVMRLTEQRKYHHHFSTTTLSRMITRCAVRFPSRVTAYKPILTATESISHRFLNNLYNVWNTEKSLLSTKFPVSWQTAQTCLNSFHLSLSIPSVHPSSSLILLQLSLLNLPCSFCYSPSVLRFTLLLMP